MIPTKYVLIDDDEIVNCIHQEIIMIDDPSADIRVFSSSREGLAHLVDLIQSNQSLPEFLFLDIRMPELDGFAVLDALSHYPAQHFEHTRLYMLTSSLDDRDRAKAVQSSLVHGFRSKTLTVEMLQEMRLDRG
jgi:CheY-like chemotaxis protein